jgi:hypothetical protein
VLRFWNVDVMKERDSVAEAIFRAGSEPHPSPKPSSRSCGKTASTLPQGEGGRSTDGQFPTTATTVAPTARRATWSRQSPACTRWR